MSLKYWKATRARSVAQTKFFARDDLACSWVAVIIRNVITPKPSTSRMKRLLPVRSVRAVNWFNGARAMAKPSIPAIAIQIASLHLTQHRLKAFARIVSSHY